MKLPTKTIIGKEKIKNYLLQAKKRNDKSKWLAQAGYTVDEWQLLQDDLRTQILPLEAILTDQTEYGQMYEIRATLTGPNGRTLRATTVWMTEYESGVTKFITMSPDKSRG